MKLFHFSILFGPNVDHDEAIRRLKLSPGVVSVVPLEHDEQDELVDHYPADDEHEPDEEEEDAPVLSEVPDHIKEED